MTYEKDIPEYAMQPAKAPKVIPAEAVYHTQTLTCPAEEQTVGKRLVDALPGRFVQRLGAQRDAVALPDVGIRWNAHSAPS